MGKTSYQPWLIDCVIDGKHPHLIVQNKLDAASHDLLNLSIWLSKQPNQPICSRITKCLKAYKEASEDYIVFLQGELSQRQSEIEQNKLLTKVINNQA